MINRSFHALGDAIILSAGWRRRLIAFIAGAFGCLALAPFDLFPALLVPMTVAVWLIDGSARSKPQAGVFRAARFASLRVAAADGWWLGFGFFVAGFWWLGSALLVDADQFAWALPFAVLGLPAVLALFTALGFAIARLLWSPGSARILALAAGLGAVDWLRGHVFTGFPWNEFGMALGGNLVLAQFGSIVGLYGLNVLAVAIFAAPATLIDVDSIGRARRGARAWLGSAPILACVALGALSLFGAFRLAAGHVGEEPNVRLRIMQPNIAEDDKFRPENKDAILAHYLSLSDRATSPQTSGVADVTHLIWPESAFPFILSRDAGALGRIGAFLGRKTILITGAARIGAATQAERPGDTRTIYYNSIQAIDGDGAILDTYDKVHLVPFGEYLPFTGFLERFGLRHMVHIPGGFDAGTRRKLLRVPGLPPAAALICYEAIFPGAATPPDALVDRPGFILNVSNDAWFGRTPGPYQHFAQARLRSIEEGLPLVRAANTGVSGIVDPYGRVLKQLPVGVEGVIDGGLPKRIDPTFFARHPFVGTSLLLLLAFVGSFPRRRRA